MNLIDGELPTTAQAVARYEAIQPRLPDASFPQESIHRAHLGELLSDIDCFVLDGFGVLNVGPRTGSRCRRANSAVATGGNRATGLD